VAPFSIMAPRFKNSFPAFLLLFSFGTATHVWASAKPGLSSTLPTSGGATTEATVPEANKTPLSANFIFGFPANISDSPITPLKPSAHDSSSTAETGRARIYEYGRTEEGEPAWHHTNAALNQAMNLGVDMVYIHLSAFADFNVTATDIRNKLSEFDKPMTVFLDNGTNASGAIISLQSESTPSSNHKSQVKTSVYKLEGNQFKEKYASYVNHIVNQNAIPNKGAKEVNASEVSNTFPQLNYIEPIAVGKLSPKSNNILIFNYKPSLFETTLDVLLKPLTTYLLLVIMLLGLVLELRKPGTGFPLFATIAASFLFLIPRNIDGLAERSEIIFYASGVVLILLQRFMQRKGNLLLIAGVAIMGVGLILCMTPPLSVLSASRSSWTEQMNTLLLVAASFTTIGFLFKTFPGLKAKSKPDIISVHPHGLTS